MDDNSKSGPDIVKGPCVVCGITEYRLSMGGPAICPACDCSIDPTDPRHPKNLLVPAEARPIKFNPLFSAKVKTTCVLGEPEQYNGWTGVELLGLVQRLNAENKDKDAEIAQLKTSNTALQRECATRAQRTANLEKLIIRATDELEKKHGRLLYPESCPHCVLVSELRKATN